MKKATRQFTKNHNINLVLKTIFQQKEISRAEISRLTRLTRTTVSDIVSTLMEDGLVEEIGLGESIGGKPPVLVSVPDHARAMICMDLSRRGFSAAVVNLRGQILQRSTGGRERWVGEDALNQIFAQLDPLVQNNHIPLLGIGIGTPGLIDTAAGIVKRAVNLGWQNLPLKQILTERYQVPVHIVNDSHAAALAEYAYGDWRDTPNLIVLKAGDGIGSGIVLNGKLFYGDGFAAGEVGHLVVTDEDITCTCGNRGCLETVSSARAILNAAQQVHPVLNLGSDKLTMEDIRAAFDSGNPEIVNIVSKAAKGLGVAVANLIGILDVHHIVISGELTDLGEGFLSLICEQARQRALSNMLEDSQLHFSGLGADHVLLGASALVLSLEMDLP